MKEYEVSALYVIVIVKVVAKYSIIITNPNCGKHMPNKCYRKHISVLDEVIREKKNEKEKEGNCIIIKESGNEDSINSWLNSPHKKGLGNLMEMI